jgi:predicted transposase/invertase (TIGR01784 family)
VGKVADFSQEDRVAYTAAFLAWEQVVENRGRQEGRQARESEIVLNMLRKQLDLETIAEVTGLPIAQIQQLQSQAATS